MQKIFASFALILLCATVALAVNAPFQQCFNNPVFTPKALDITPASPKAGDTLTAVTTGQVTTPISGGILYADIYLSGVKLFEYSYNLCQIVVGGCPIGVGNQAIKIQNQIPSFAFPGTYQTVASAYLDSSKSKELACVSFNFTIA
ncbi:hypothetical protein FDP41_001136 [Naegleria fowleri]|uniref:MD-2-related lipid-recognition domain-containing protein n=1 Tax=Naegleria fowleri TaxID=5763 RepID=A0A6A5BPN2_NAEFO|nr:uncharacterized protein FDP41_001136 [Naegleria fowleri]KAF0979983.1 hypothetical protein FDP41_001136 [Naegleria fowleri]